MKLLHGRSGISNTLENAYADYAVGRFAEALGKQDDAHALYKTALNYRNTFDRSVGWFRARGVHTDWTPWSGRLSSTDCVESNPEQQGWFVPQDVAGLIDLVGGRQEFVKQLDTALSGIRRRIRSRAGTTGTTTRMSRFTTCRSSSPTPVRRG